jgi:carboxyl-terminal processing protease
MLTTALEAPKAVKSGKGKVEGVTPLELVQEALELIENNALERTAINWPEQKPKWLNEALVFTDLSEAHELISRVLKNLGDNHSHLIAAAKTLADATFDPDNPVPSGFLFNKYIGVVEIPEHGGDGKMGDGSNYASVVQDILYDLEQQGASAWIIDLRNNGGGNMWPMLAGLAPLLGRETLGAFANPHTKERNDWHEILWSTNNPLVEAQLPLLKNRAAPVALLTSKKTLSSGEAVLISFLGRLTPRTFGEPTGGLLTANAPFQLCDKSWLMLTTALEADRLGRLYKTSISPDVFVKIDWSKLGQADDSVLLEASKWLQTML